MTIMTGGCQCRRVRYAVPIADDEAYLCHCTYCRRATGGVSIAFRNVRAADVEWTAAAPDWYQSSPIARRPFCSTCGTPLGFQFVDGENMDLTVGSFDDPSRFRPTSNFGIETVLPAWLDVSHLTGRRLDEHQPAVDRWIKAIGKLLTELPVLHFEGRDGAALAYREMGEGRPIVLIHGFFSNAITNWVRYGHAAKIAAKGYRVIMPDLRGHGDSTRSHDPAAYPRDVLADDGFALIDHLGIADYDLGGYSLGARTTMRMLARGARPGRAIIAGMGLDGIVHTAGRGGHFRRILTHLGTFERGSAEWMAEAFLKTTGGDPQALLLVLDTFADTPRAALDAIDLPMLVLTGIEDKDNGSAEDLAAALPRSQYRTMPGNHMSAVTRPEFGVAIADFLITDW